MHKFAALATISLSFNVISFYSMVWHIHNTKDTNSLNWLYLLGNVVAQILLIIYGYYNASPEIYYPTAALFAGLLYIIYVKYSSSSCSECNNNNGKH